MGDRYFLTIKCSKCGVVDNDVYYAPTCGFTEYTCKCGQILDLQKYTGISYEDASTQKKIEKALSRIRINTPVSSTLR